MRRPAQGEVWWAELPDPSGRRPVLILTRTAAIAHLTNVTVAPLTRASRGVASEVDLSPREGLPTACAVSLENIQTLARACLDGRIATLSPARMGEVFGAIRYVFDMPDH